ncbi:polysaccharide biosynthesis protein [Candidatus Microthrix sp.]|jgi:FlaA1/EpsC-like NDP-sugar epimerase|uniref:polysaccharide biosynthesis protein n=1 Tax=Candidatus Neomicrothrix sp. TaxID=2719034 RepID=UPI002597D59A|nr:nucleoside-diphosphate sugar epimerase/dehydratase [Candidatus Microthrix sp.]HMS47582.1 nucleoside-diphosphate sugar epimerase/dehydratase [Candidatus Microthrix sp.]
MTSPLGPRSTAVIERLGGVHRRAVMGSLDSLAWFFAVLATSSLAFVESRKAFDVGNALLLALLAAGLQIGAGWAAGLYRKAWRAGSVEEVHRVVRAATITTIGMVLCTLLLTDARRQVAAVLLAGPLAAFIQLGVRLVLRWSGEQLRAAGNSRDGKRPALVFGAGTAGSRVIDAMLNEDSDLYPVGLLDDDRRLANLRVRSVSVHGTRADLARVTAATGAEVLVLAMPASPSEEWAAIGRDARECGLEVLNLPPVTQLFDTVTVKDFKPVSTHDLLGRDQVRTGLMDISNYLSDKRVLVTGAGGSIGSELCRQIRQFNPAKLVMLDIDDTSLQELQLSLDGHGLLNNRALVIASVRDPQRMLEVFETHRPQVVFHAAALKHLPLLEQNPDEGFKTNTLGTLNVLEAAAATGVERVVNVSTDKAADPTSVLGITKRQGERLAASFADSGRPGTYLSVRFGNVLGSRGSMLPTFRRQIAAGGPVTVTDPDATRYFMTVEEACGLVIDAGAVGSSGEVLVLDMGEPVKIADVANRLANEVDPPVDVVFTGLRPGEKLHEVLLSLGEDADRPHHPLISHVPVAPFSEEECEVLCDQIREVAPGWVPGQASDGARQGAFLTLRQLAG